MSADGEADCLVTVYDQTSKNYGTVMTDLSGDFDFTVSGEDSLSVATYGFTYTLTDAAGNVSAPSRTVQPYGKRPADCAEYGSYYIGKT